MSIKRSYSELKKLKTFEERFEYLKLDGKVSEETFGYDRYLNQFLYKSKEWKDVKRKVTLRDLGNDLGIDGRPIQKYAIVHHMNPITKYDIINKNPDILNPEYLILVSHNTHNAIHYGDEKNVKSFVERKKFDHIPWKKSK